MSTTVRTELALAAHGDVPTRWELESQLRTRQGELTPNAFIVETAALMHKALLQVAQLKRQVMLEERDVVLKALRAERDELKAKVERDAGKLALVHVRGRDAFFWLGDEHDARWQGDRAVIMPVASFRENMAELEELRAFKAQVLEGTGVQAAPFKEAEPEPPQMEPIPAYGDHMTLEKFKAACERGHFVNADGHGDCATATEVFRNRTVVPSDDLTKLGPDVTHVVWYNK